MKTRRETSRVLEATRRKRGEKKRGIKVSRRRFVTSSPQISHPWESGIGGADSRHEPWGERRQRHKVAHGRDGYNENDVDQRGIDRFRRTCGECSTVTPRDHTYSNTYRHRRLDSSWVRGIRFGTKYSRYLSNTGRRRRLGNVGGGWCWI